MYDYQRVSSYPSRELSDIKTISIHHWAGGSLTQQSTTQEELDAIDEIRALHTSDNPRFGWPDYAYHFTVCPSGRCYYTGSVNTLRYVVGTWSGNKETLAIALPGNFMTEIPGTLQLEACAKLVADLQFAFGGKLKVVPHKFYGGTQCPGDTWDQWKGIIDGTNALSSEDGNALRSGEAEPDVRELESGENNSAIVSYARTDVNANEAEEVLLSQYPYPENIGNAKDIRTWRMGWGRSLQESVGLSERLERSFIYLVLGYAESGWDHTIQNTAGEPSWGIFQRHLYGSASNMRKEYGWDKTVEMLTDPSLKYQFDWAHTEVDAAFDRWWAAGKRGPELAILVGRDAERPAAGSESKYGKAWTTLRSQVAW